MGKIDRGKTQNIRVLETGSAAVMNTILPSGQVVWRCSTEKETGLRKGVEGEIRGRRLGSS